MEAHITKQAHPTAKIPHHHKIFHTSCGPCRHAQTNQRVISLYCFKSLFLSSCGLQEVIHDGGNDGSRKCRPSHSPIGSPFFIKSGRRTNHRTHARVQRIHWSSPYAYANPDFRPNEKTSANMNPPRMESTQNMAATTQER